MVANMGVSEVQYVGRDNYYDYLVQHDVISHVRFLLERAGYGIRISDQKIYCEHQINWDYPWHHVKRSDTMDCHMWHRIMFDVVNETLPTDRKFVPSQCQDCWKVVVRPQTLKQLFALLDLQIRLGRHSKCGIEDRKSVRGNYGGYFYNRGANDGLECYVAVRDAIREDEHLKSLLEEVDENGVPKLVILKRGCTEFEHLLGRSDQWHVTKEQMALEEMLNDVFVRQLSSEIQPWYVINHIHRKWIEFAWDRNDPTVMEFTGEKLIYPPYVTYHYVAELPRAEMREITQEEFEKLQADLKEE